MKRYEIREIAWQFVICKRLHLLHKLGITFWYSVILWDYSNAARRNLPRSGLWKKIHAMIVSRVRLYNYNTSIWRKSTLYRAFPSDERKLTICYCNRIFPVLTSSMQSGQTCFDSSNFHSTNVVKIHRGKKRGISFEE